jgi:hypothetical protein
VVDANGIAALQKARLAGHDQVADHPACRLCSDSIIAVDEGLIMRQEWLNTANLSRSEKLNLGDWIADGLIKKRIVLRTYRNDGHILKRLEQYGMQRKDAKYIDAARQFGAFAVISNDIGMYEPAAKRQDTASQERIKQRRTGQVCNYARREWNVEVVTFQHLCDIVPTCAR